MLVGHSLRVLQQMLRGQLSWVNWIRVSNYVYVSGLCLTMGRRGGALVGPMVVPSLICLLPGSTRSVLPLLFNLVNVRKTVLISARCGEEPVEMPGRYKGQEVAECL